MILWVPARENDIGTTDLTPVGYSESKHSRVEILHLLQVMDIEPDMTHA